MHGSIPAGYGRDMSTTPEPPRSADPPIELEGVPEEEGISEADAAERVDLDPDEQQNRKDVE